MIDSILENIRSVGPVFAAVWISVVLFTVLRPQKYLNSILLMIALPVTMVFAAGFFSREARGSFLLACFLMVMLGLLLVPALLIINGIRMIRRESFCLAHTLSLILGIAVGIGEIAAAVYVMGLSGYFDLGKANRWILFLWLTVFYFSSLVLSFVVYSVFIQIMPHRMNCNYVIIHGCGLADGERLTRLLSDRVDKAVEIYGKCRIKPVIIPSGGRGSDEKLSEAQAMKDYLVKHGIPEDHIVLEDRSATTRENLINSKKIIDAREGGKKTVLVSSNYHIYRCLRLAREAGLKCTGIGARVALYFWPSALIREFIAVFLTKGFMIPALIGYALFIAPVMYVIFTAG